MKKILLAAAAIPLWIAPALALNDTIGVTVGAGKTANLIKFGSNNVISETGVCDATTENQCASVSAAGAVKTDSSAVTQPISAASLPLPTGASTAAKQPALGTAGTASTDVISIQGIASMTKLLVTPDSVALPANQSVNVNQFAGTTLGAITTYGTSPGAVNVQSVNAFVTNANTNGVAAQASASPVVLAFSASTTLQNAAVASGNGTDLELEGYGGAVLHVVCSVACSGGTTINFEASFDGATYVAIQGTPIGGGAPVSTATTTGDFGFNTAGYSDLRARISAYSAGTITVTGFAASQSALQPAGIALPANQSVNVAQFGGVSTSTGQVAVSVAPVTATNTALVVDLRPDSPGIIALGTNTAANSVPVVLSTTPTIANGSGVVNAPSTEALAGIVPVVSAALESNHVCKASAGNFYSGSVTTGATAGWLLLANSTTAPTAGGAAIAPIAWAIAPANATVSINSSVPIRGSTGLTLVFSTSGIFTNTASATAAFSCLVS